jgi:hypothetical protein
MARGVLDALQVQALPDSQSQAACSDAWPVSNSMSIWSARLHATSCTNAPSMRTFANAPVPASEAVACQRAAVQQHSIHSSALRGLLLCICITIFVTMPFLPK